MDSIEPADDLRTVTDWLGVSSPEEMTTEHHERFARAVESYLMEGRAPSPALIQPFRRFAAWLSQIYGSARSLDVEVSPELRPVLDRLLATDAEIAGSTSHKGAASLRRIQRLVGKELVKAGYAPDEAEIQARLIASRYAARASRLGTTPEHEFARAGQGAGVRVQSADEAARPFEGVPAWSEGKMRNPAVNLKRHWDDHKAQFQKHRTKEDYASAARAFLDDPPPGTETWTLGNGNVLRYHEPTNTFGIRHANGAPRTMFRPTNRRAYWIRQLK